MVIGTVRFCGRLALVAMVAVAARVGACPPVASVTAYVAEVMERIDYQTRTYPGRVTPVALANVRAQVSGEIIEVCFSNGSAVVQGQTLYRIDSVKYEAAARNAEARVAECKANLLYAEQSHERHKRLIEARAVSRDAADSALAQRDTARAALAAAEAELVSARDDLKHCVIVAPLKFRPFAAEGHKRYLRAVQAVEVHDARRRQDDARNAVFVGFVQQ